MSCMGSTSRKITALVFAIGVASPIGAQFLETFNSGEIKVDPSGVDGWSFFSGDGEATIELVATDDGYASILVDATRDQKNIWWALIKHRVSEQMDLARLVRPGWELRIEARIRSSHAPRRVNLHLNTQRTTDFHSHLMEFDIPNAGEWHMISMTTRDFPGEPGDTIFAQMALMDWGLDTYRVDVDYLKVDIVSPADRGPDLGEPLPYHPPIPDGAFFSFSWQPDESAVVDVSQPDVHFTRDPAPEGDEKQRLLTVGGSKWVILRWNVDSLWGRRVEGPGLLELTTHEVVRGKGKASDPPLLRVVEILGGDPEWSSDTVTLESLTRGKDVDSVFNPQMIIDWPVTEKPGGKTSLTISRPALQRLAEGRTLGLAIRPLGPGDAEFIAGGENGPRLHLNIQE